MIRPRDENHVEQPPIRRQRLSNMAYVFFQVNVIALRNYLQVYSVPPDMEPDYLNFVFQLTRFHQFSVDDLKFAICEWYTHLRGRALRCREFQLHFRASDDTFRHVPWYTSLGDVISDHPFFITQLSSDPWLIPELTSCRFEGPQLTIHVTAHIP